MITEKLSEEEILNIDLRIKEGSKFTKDELYSSALNIKKNSKITQLKLQNQINEQLKEKEKEKLEYDILHNIELYKKYKFCNFCEGSQGLDTLIECQPLNAQYYFEDEFSYLGWKKCKRCNGLGYIKLKYSKKLDS